MSEMGIATIFPSEVILSSTVCTGCKNKQQCDKGEGVLVIIRGIGHLFLPDYKNSWTLSVDLPNCEQPGRLFSLARIKAILYTGTRAQITGRIIESRIKRLAELDVIEL